MMGDRGESVFWDLTNIKRKFSLLGLELNPEKCELYVLKNVKERQDEILNKITEVYYQN